MKVFLSLEYDTRGKNPLVIITPLSTSDLRLGDNTKLSIQVVLAHPRIDFVFVLFTKRLLQAGASMK